MNTAALPDADYSVYGVDVKLYNDDGDCIGAIAGGHGRRSYAAINTAIRRYNLDRKSAKNRWVVHVDRCGCSETQHAAHIADDVDCPCQYYGLAPCDVTGRITQLICHASADTPGAISVLEVLW